MRHWVGVASRDHVRTGAAGGVCQLCHGKAPRLRRLRPGDRIAYYSPGTRMGGGEPVQGLTALRVVGEGEPYPFDMGGGFVPLRRPVAFLATSDAPIRPMLPLLSFTKGRASWGYAFRRGAVEITPEDFAVIAGAMGIDVAPTTQSGGAPGRPEGRRTAA